MISPVRCAVCGILLTWGQPCSLPWGEVTCGDHYQWVLSFFGFTLAVRQR